MKKLLGKLSPRLSPREWLIVLALVVILVLIAWPSMGSLFPVDPNPTFQELRYKVDRIDVVDTRFKDEELNGRVTKVVASINQPEELDALFSRMELCPYDRYGGGVTHSTYSPLLEFYSGDQLVDSIGFIQGSNSVRWGRQSRYDIHLEGMSHLYFCEWFKELKVTGYYQPED